MQAFEVHSLRRKIVLLAGGLITLVFLGVIGLTSLNMQERMRESIYHDLETKNQGYVQTILSVFRDKAIIILAMRDDLELYDSRGQMWVHMAAHTGEIVFDDPAHGDIYKESFDRKLAAYRDNGQLSGEHLTPQVRKMVDKFLTRENAFGEGMKFFYIGVAAPNADPLQQGYDQYQDSSLWVPDTRVDAPYNPLTRPWYLAGQEAGRHRVVFTEPYAERRTGEALVSGATAIQVEGVQGTLAGGISIKPIMDAILRSFRDDAHITIFSGGTQNETAYVSRQPKYIYSSRDASLGDQFRAYDDRDIRQVPANRDLMNIYDATRGRDAGVLEWVIGGDRRLVAFNTVHEVGWKLFISVSQERFMAEAIAAQYRNIAISLAGLALLLLVISAVVKRALQPLDTISRELIELADTGDLSKRTSVRSKDEVGRMATAINEMLDNTAAPVRELARQARKIADGDRDADVSIVAKGDIAQLVTSFNEMKRRLVDLEASYRDASPLTGLPGGVSIETEVQRRIDDGVPFVFCMFDLDNFKPFNDRYGYSRGNLVLKHTATLIRNEAAAHDPAHAFVGHIGGDDFVVIASPEYFNRLCNAIIVRFDTTIGDFYDPADRASGGISSKDRGGDARSFPIMALSIAAVDSRQVLSGGYIRVGEIAAELKSYAKTLQGSVLVVDQRIAGTPLPSARAERV